MISTLLIPIHSISLGLNATLQLLPIKYVFEVTIAITTIYVHLIRRRLIDIEEPGHEVILIRCLRLNDELLVSHSTFGLTLLRIAVLSILTLLSIHYLLLVLVDLIILLLLDLLLNLHHNKLLPLNTDRPTLLLTIDLMRLNSSLFGFLLQPLM